MKYSVVPTVLFIGLLVSSISAFSSEEKNALKKLRPIVSDALYQDYMKEDVYLIQWLRNTNLDPAKANQAIRKTHLWRKEKNMDAILGEDWSKFEKEFPYTLAGHDKEGRPMSYIFGPKWDLRKAVLKGQRDELIRFWVQMWEQIATKARETFNVTVPTATGVRDVPDCIVIHDIQGYTPRLNGCLACIPVVLASAGDLDKHYSYTLHETYSVNTPKIFENLIQLIRNVLSENLNKRFKVFGTDRREFMEYVSKVIEPGQLKQHFKY